MSYKLPPPASTKTVCPVCGKRISRKGINDHLTSHKDVQVIPKKELP